MHIFGLEKKTELFLRELRIMRAKEQDLERIANTQELPSPREISLM
jgi:hypothetical protein